MIDFCIIFFSTENLTDEERIWEEIHEIKTMPVSMAQKREMKAQLKNATKLRLQGFDQIKWQRRKFWQQFTAKSTEFLAKMELWRTSLKSIEGNFGTGVVAYFLFLRWLILLNLSIFSLILIFIVLPHAFLNDPNENVGKCDPKEASNSTECCTEQYINRTNSNSDFFILDLIQGTGFMERTIMFYGMYSNKIFSFVPSWASAAAAFSPPVQPPTAEPTAPAWPSYDDDDGDTPLGILFNATSQSTTTVIPTDSRPRFYYDLPLAFVSVTVLYLLMTLIAIVKSVSREFKDRLVEGEGQFYQYCNLVFGGWDFCIHNGKSALVKHKALMNEIQALIQTKRIELERHNRSKDVMIKLMSIRLLINLFVCIILIAAAALIYVLFNISLQYFINRNFTPLQTIESDGTITIHNHNQIYLGNFLSFKRNDYSRMSEQLINLFFEFLPYITIVCLNLFVPIVFNYLVQFEKYSPMFVIKISLLRTVFLRLSSLAVLISRFYFLIKPDEERQPYDCYNTQRGTPMCWETFVGQQFYKLFILDFVTHVFVTFFVNFPRALLARHIDSRFTRFIGEQEFELSKHVLDIVYSQTLCWLGTFYTPFLPAIAVCLQFFMFYIKKFACLVNSKPSAVLYRASRSNSLFMFVLLLSFVLAVIPIVYAAAEIMPSRSCGPFRGLNSVWDAAIQSFLKLPIFCQNVIFFLATAKFAVPCFVVLILFLYYYYAVSVANKHMVEVLKNQLVLEGHDKQFLLNRLSAFIKEQQEYQRKMRQAAAQKPKPYQADYNSGGGGSAYQETKIDECHIDVQMK